MNTNEKNQRTLKHLQGMLSSAGQVSINKEILYSENSLSALSRIIQKNPLYSDSNNNKITKLIQELDKMYGAESNENSIKFTSPNKQKVNEEFQKQLGVWIMDLLPENTTHPNTWNIFKDLKDISLQFISNIQPENQKCEVYFHILKRYLEYFITIAEYEEVKIMLNMADLQIRSGNLSKAQEIELLLLRAEFLRKYGENRESEKILGDCINKLQAEKIPSSALAKAYSELGLVLLYDDQLRFEEAYEYFQEALELYTELLGSDHESSILCKIHLIEYKTQTDKIEGVEDELKTMLQCRTIQNNPLLISLVYNSLGMLRSDEDNYSEKFRILDEEIKVKNKLLPKNHPLLIESFHNMGIHHMINGDSDEAIKYFSKTFNNFKNIYSPGHQNYLCVAGSYAWCNIQLGNIAIAHKVLTEALEEIYNYPRKSYGLITRAVDTLVEYYFHQEEFKNEGIILGKYIPLLKAFNKKENSYEVLLNRYHHLVKINRNTKALKEVRQDLSDLLFLKLKNKIAQGVNRTFWYNHYGMTFKNVLNDFERAGQCYKMAIDTGVADSSTYNNLALLQSTIFKNDDEAESLYKTSLSMERDSIITLGNYGFFLQNARSNFYEAEFCYKEAIKKTATNNAILNHLAALKIVQGETPEARDLVKQAINSNYTSQTRHLAISFLLSTILDMFDCKNHIKNLGHIKFAIDYGIEHVPWDNRTIMEFVMKVLNKEEAELIQNLFLTLNDFQNIVKLEKLKIWNDVAAEPYK